MKKINYLFLILFLIYGCSNNNEIFSSSSINNGSVSNNESSYISTNNSEKESFLTSQSSEHNLSISFSSFETDPYINMSQDEFYTNYKPASCYKDAYYRSLHGFMSGFIDDVSPIPTVSENQPKLNDKLIRNTSSYYSSDKKAYTIVDYKGEPVTTIYKGGAYISLEEVAAYLLAFDDIPANYIESKKGYPSESIWGKYLRVNHSYFKYNPSKYPYEPELPHINNGENQLLYYEMDIGTTGTDTGEGYSVNVYNDGEKITRGAARIVYSRYDANENNIIDINEKYVFYTYNHYNDFQEYLNYYNGWGYIFGNITGGGTISSKTDYNPTPYIETERSAF